MCSCEHCNNDKHIPKLPTYGCVMRIGMADVQVDINSCGHSDSDNKMK